jgi:hypothetical protein
MRFFGFCARELPGEIFLQTTETGKTLIADSAVGVRRGFGKNCWNYS